jgi:hypothetical protein
MKKIEAVVRRSELRQFFLCAEKLGIFGFDLCPDRNSSVPVVGGHGSPPSRLMVEFAVSDADTKDTIHAVLDQAHPDSIAVFKLGPESSSRGGAGSGADPTRVR